MYLSNAGLYLLDRLVKDFEVAYRSFTVDTIKGNFKDETSLGKHLVELTAQLDNSSLLNASKYKYKIGNILSDLPNNFRAIESCYDAFLKKEVPTKSTVPYVSTVIDYIEILFEPYFKKSKLLNGFQINDFFSLTYDFHRVRNDLAHPASSRVSVATSKEIIRFIEKVLLNIDDTYFWYSGKDRIRNLISQFLTSLQGLTIPFNNIIEIAYTHKKLIQREVELSTLKELIFGKKEFQFYRKARSIVIYGYGGLGKTALVLELINEIIKESADLNLNPKLDFLLYFTAKEEELVFSPTKYEYQINEIRKQIISYDNFIENLFKYLRINSLEEMSALHGILVIDNIETLKGDREKILDFIKIMPESIQVIVTSREEEIADNKIALRGFENKGQGIKFIREYIDEYNLRIVYKEEYEQLISASKGNTLILILSLLRLNENEGSFNQIISELNQTSSASISTVANFMYKNTFDQAIEEIEKRGVNSKKILSIIAYFGEPIDLYSLAVLSDLKNISKIEDICNILVQKLVLTKRNETYEINEFASKFIVVKIIPNKVEAQFITNKISTFKFERRKILRALEENRSNDRLNKIMLDWAPRNNVEKIAIAEAFSLWSVANKNDGTVTNGDAIAHIKKRFAEIESYSQHPYVKFQKARIFSRLLKRRFNQEYLNIITNSYEDVIFSIKFDYQYIAKPQSFAAVLWLYGIFISKNFEDYSISARSFEEAKVVCEGLGLRSGIYLDILRDLKDSYGNLYRKTRDKSFLAMRDSL